MSEIVTLGSVTELHDEGVTKINAQELDLGMYKYNAAEVILDDAYGAGDIDELSHLLHKSRIRRDVGLAEMKFADVSKGPASLMVARNTFLQAVRMSGSALELARDLSPEDQGEVHSEHGATITSLGRLARYGYVLYRDSEQLDESIEHFEDASIHLSEGKKRWYRANNAIRFAESVRLAGRNYEGDHSAYDLWQYARAEARNADDIDKKPARKIVVASAFYLGSKKLTAKAVELRP